MIGTQGVQSPIVELVAVAVIIFAVAAIGIMTGLVPVPYARNNAPPLKTCPDCGVVESVKPVAIKDQGASGSLGAAAGNEVGAGRGGTPATVAGAAGGAYAGNEVGTNMKMTTYYQVSVRMNDGSVLTLNQRADPGVHAGDSVKVANGVVIRE